MKTYMNEVTKINFLHLMNSSWKTRQATKRGIGNPKGAGEHEALGNCYFHYDGL